MQVSGGELGGKSETSKSFMRSESRVEDAAEIDDAWFKLC